MTTLKQIDGWICTDPDNLQYRLKSDIDTNQFTYKEFDRLSYPDFFEYYSKPENDITTSEYWADDTYWIEDTIYLVQYSYRHQYEAVSGYYSGIDDVVEQYGLDAEMIIAEIIFEQESGLY